MPATRCLQRDASILLARGEPFLDAMGHPRWWFDLLTTEPLPRFTDFRPGTVGEYLNTICSTPAFTFDFWPRIKSQWPGKPVVKGIH